MLGGGGLAGFHDAVRGFEAEGAIQVFTVRAITFAWRAFSRFLSIRR